MGSKKFQKVSLAYGQMLEVDMSVGAEGKRVKG
jgi:hypothetical protein